MYDLIVVGGGASGVFTAITYKLKNQNKEVLILEKSDELLKKIKATGNGKCNFFNKYLNKDIYNDPSFVSYYINEDTKKEVLDIFTRLGLGYKELDEGRMYPNSEDAKSVIYILMEAIKNLNINVLLNTELKSIKEEKEYLLVNNIKTKKVVIATGGVSYPKLSSDGSSYEIIKKLNHHFTKLYPGNNYIFIKNKELNILEGLRFKVKLSLYTNKLIHEEEGELLIKKDAISGIVSFNISTYLAREYLKGSTNPYILIDFSNGLDINDPKSFIISNLNLKLLKILKTKDDIKGYKVIPLPKFDFTNSQVMVGGIKLDELKPSLESKMIKNLYFVGEIINIDAPCGGYNLGHAFLSALNCSKNL